LVTTAAVTGFQLLLPTTFSLVNLNIPPAQQFMQTFNGLP